MGVVFSDSFAHYSLADLLYPRKWDAVGSNTASYSLEYAYGLFPGMPGFRMGSSTNAWIQKTIASTAAFDIGFWMYIESGGGADDAILQVYDTGTIHLDLRLLSTQHLRVTRNGTTLATSTNILNLGQPYFIEFKGNIHDTTGAIEVRVNGTSVDWIPSATGLDTRNGANASINQVRMGHSSNSGGVLRFGGIFIQGDAGGVPDFLGVVRPYILRPIGPGTNDDFTPNWADRFANVAEHISDGDTSFNMSSTAAHKDTFEHAKMPAAASVAFVAANLTARNDPGATKTIRPILVDSGGTRNGDSVALTTGYKTYQSFWALNPADSAAWETADLNDSAFEAGYELVS